MSNPWYIASLISTGVCIWTIWRVPSYYFVFGRIGLDFFLVDLYIMQQLELSLFTMTRWAYVFASFITIFFFQYYIKNYWKNDRIYPSIFYVENV